MTTLQTGDQPYCGNCGYQLTGLTDSARCPECGKPIVEVLQRKGFPIAGKRYRSDATLFGWPVLAIARGPSVGERLGVARGIIAIGDIAIGGIALGGISVGIVSVGGFSVGALALGGGAIGALAAMGGTALGGVACGAMAVGILAFASVAVGVWAQGIVVVGMHARTLISTSRKSAGAVLAFQPVRWFFGSWPPSGLSAIRPLFIIASLIVLAAGIIGLVARLAWLKHLKAKSIS